MTMNGTVKWVHIHALVIALHIQENCGGKRTCTLAGITEPYHSSVVLMIPLELCPSDEGDGFKGTGLEQPLGFMNHFYFCSSRISLQ